MYFKTADVAGLRLFYREAGDPSKPTIVLLHGFPSSSYQFHDLIPRLADRFHVIAPDYPGMGYSDAPAPSSQQPLDRQQRQHRHCEAPPDAGTGLFFLHDLLTVVSIDPVQLAGVAKTNLIGAGWHLVGEPPGERIGQRGTVDHEPHFGVEPGRTGIEVERPHEHPCTVDGERLGMQAGRRGAGARTPGPVDTFPGARRSAFELEQRN